MKRLISFVVMLSLGLIAIGFGTQAIQAHPSEAPATVTINMKDFTFDVKDITIPVGTSIIWSNTGTKKHTATADDNSFNTGTIAPGASSAPIVFSKPGKIPYYCQFHGAPGGVDMSGTITVVAQGADQGAVATAEATTPALAATATAVPPTPAPAAATTSVVIAPSTAKPIGNVTFADKAKNAHGDSVTITITAIPLPDEGQQYEAWLSDGHSGLLSLGKLDVKTNGTATLAYADPKGANLIGQFSAVLITTQGTDLTKPGPITFSGLVPPQADIHVRHLMFKFPDTPDNIGLLVGALEQEAILTQHVGFMNDALAKNNIPLAKLHLEHIHNLMTGTSGAKDLDGDGKLAVIPPGDGFGIFNYLTVASQHADLAAKQPDATDAIKVKASHIKIAAANASTTLTQIQQLAIQAATKTSVADMKPLADQITKLNATVVKGVADASGAVTPTKDSAGLGLAYAEGLAMAGFNLVPGDVTAPLTAQPAATSPAAAASVTPAPSANTITVVMSDFQFTDKTITIKAGTSVIFSNQGTKKHTATADDNSFDTGVILPGASSAPVKFDKPGTFPYFCQFHGAPGGVDMAGVITVQ